MKQVSHSSRVERMWQAGNGQDKEGIYEVLVNLNNSLNEGPQEPPPNPPLQLILQLSSQLPSAAESMLDNKKPQTVPLFFY